MGGGMGWVKMGVNCVLPMIHLSSIYFLNG